MLDVVESERESVCVCVSCVCVQRVQRRSESAVANRRFYFRENPNFLRIASEFSQNRTTRVATVFFFVLPLLLTLNYRIEEKRVKKHIEIFRIFLI